VNKDKALDRINPFGDRGVTEQLDAWAAALEMAVSTLNRTLAEFKEFQKKGGPDVGPEARRAAGDGGEHGGERSDG
jgi:hypothetical protein